MSFVNLRPLTRIRTLRGRLALWHLTALALTLCAFAGLLYEAVARSLYGHHDGALRRQASELTDRIGELALTEAAVLKAIAASTTTPRFVMVRDAAGALLFQEPVLSLNEPNIGRNAALVHAAQSNTNGPEFFTTTLERSGQVRFICLPLGRPDRFLQIGDPLGDVRETLDTVVFASLSLVPVVLLVSGSVGWMVVKGALAPVRTIRETLEDIHATDLSRRVEPDPRDQDLGALIVTLNRLLDRLERAFESLRQFASDVSHQIQTPLTVIKGTLQSAQRRGDRAPESAWLETLEREVEEIRTVVVDLQALALADAPVGDAADVTLTHVVTEAAEIVAALGELHGVDVRCQAESGIVVRGDATRLKQVVLNLGDNAVKYTPPGGRVTIHLDAAGEHARLRVTDTGIGIPERDLSRVFERFFRTDVARQRTTGTGLGLAIVKRIVEVHRGTVEVVSRAGTGSTFVVTLPRA